MNAQATSAQFAYVISRLRRGEELEKLAPLERRQGVLTAEDARGDQRWRLLGATAFVVSARGYWPATIAEIAQAANVSKKTFYQHFSSKEEAFLAAYDIVDVVIAEVRIALDLTSVDTLVATWVQRYLSMLGQAPEYAQMLMFQPLGSTPAIRARRIAGWGRYVVAIQEGLDQARRSGLAVADLTDTDIIGLLGGISELCIQHVSAHGVGDLEETLTRPLQLFVHRILRP